MANSSESRLCSAEAAAAAPSLAFVSNATSSSFSTNLDLFALSRSVVLARPSFVLASVSSTSASNARAASRSPAVVACSELVSERAALEADSSASSEATSDCDAENSASSRASAVFIDTRFVVDSSSSPVSRSCSANAAALASSPKLVREATCCCSSTKLALASLSRSMVWASVIWMASSFDSVLASADRLASRSPEVADCSSSLFIRARARRSCSILRELTDDSSMATCSSFADSSAWNWCISLIASLWAILDDS